MKTISKLIGVGVRRLVRHLRMLVNYAKTAHALEAAWYAMEKHAPVECSREIATSKSTLIRIGSLPIDKTQTPT